MHTKSLVKSNGEPGAWFRQTRGRVTAPWVLPYNSGYDYGAVQNDVGAVLNGRLVGVTPADGIDNVVFGIVLNSTPVTLMRLLEGVTTGNEGAFDVGPPAARVMRIPDPRLVQQNNKDEIEQIHQSLLRQRYLVPAPDRNGNVAQLRQQLDVAVLHGLGMSRGDATVLAGRIYTSYARWRAAVEDVEAQMQVHRRALSQRGGSRSDSPITQGTRAVWNEMKPTTGLLLEGLKAPGAQIIDPVFAAGCEIEEALFDSAVVPSRDGPAVDLRDSARIALAQHVREIGFTGPFPLPDGVGACVRLLGEMQGAERLFADEARLRASNYVSGEAIDTVVDEVRRRWLGASVASIRAYLDELSGTQETGPDLFDTDGMVPPAP